MYADYSLDAQWVRNIEAHFPGFDYAASNCQGPLGAQSVKMDHSGNMTGDQQRAFSIFWAIRQCSRGAPGLDIGGGINGTAYCHNLDKYATGDHPEYHCNCWPTVRGEGEDLSRYGDESLTFVNANHSLEHMEGDVVQLLRTQWLRVLAPSGILAIVLPDDDHNDVMCMEKTHRQAWSSKGKPSSDRMRQADVHEPAPAFKDVVLPGVRDLVVVREYDTLENAFSFNVVLRKRDTKRLVLRAADQPWDDPWWDDVVPTPGIDFRLADDDMYRCEARLLEIALVQGEMYQRAVLREVFRVLYPGGTLSFADTGVDAEPLRKILGDVGFERIEMDRDGEKVFGRARRPDPWA